MENVLIVFLRNLWETIQTQIMGFSLLAVVSLIFAIIAFLENKTRLKKTTTFALICVLVLIPIVIAAIDTFNYYDKSKIEQNIDNSHANRVLDSANYDEQNGGKYYYELKIKLFPSGYISKYYIVLTYIELLILLIICIAGFFGTSNQTLYSYSTALLLIVISLLLVLFVWGQNIVEMWGSFLSTGFVGAIVIYEICKDNIKKRFILSLGIWVVFGVSLVSSIIYLINYKDILSKPLWPF